MKLLKTQTLLSCYIAILLFGFTILYFNYSTTFSFAATCESTDCSSPDECQQKIKECQEIISAYSPAQNKNKEQLAALERQVANTDKLIKSAQVQADKLEQDIADRESKLESQQKLFSARVRDYYIRSRNFSPFLIFLSAESAVGLTRDLSYRNTTANEDKKIILAIAGELSSLQRDKDKLEQNRQFLAQTKEKLASQTAFLRKEVEKVEGYLGVISNRVASLNAKQQSLLAERTGTFQSSVGEVPLADDPNASPNYNPGFSPAFAAFSFGAPHRKGMSQYGAFGRAKAGQSAETILKAYYGSGVEIKKDYPSVNITVQGYGTVDLETYAKRIYEMPGSWGDEGGMEALKAQAVAARSYALARTNNGATSICATEACQVYKPANKGGRWDEAVDATRGWVLMAGGSPLSAMYASTAGGYTYSYSSNGHSTPGLWDTSCGSQSCWTGEAYEKKANSPWFYKGWYKNRSGTACGRNHPWLNQTEMADILNAVTVYRNGGDNANHILPVDYNSCFGSGGSPWSIDQMKQGAGGSAVSSVSGASVTYATNGQTAKVVFATDRGSFEVSGDEFYTVFNLRAPGRLALKSKLFNIEKK